MRSATSCVTTASSSPCADCLFAEPQEVARNPATVLSITAPTAVQADGLFMSPRWAVAPTFLDVRLGVVVEEAFDTRGICRRGRPHQLLARFG